MKAFIDTLKVFINERGEPYNSTPSIILAQIGTLDEATSG
jgi:hypothetical protein